MHRERADEGTEQNMVAVGQLFEFEVVNNRTNNNNLGCKIVESDSIIYPLDSIHMLDNIFVNDKVNEYLN